MKKIIIITIVLISSLTFLLAVSPAGNTTINSFSKSKKILLNQIYYDHQVTIYCGCRFNLKKEIDFESCGYVPRKNTKRAKRLEWEHIVPAHAFGHNFKEWSEGHPKCVTKKGKKYKGRKCANKVNVQYKLMQADMYNLYPAVGEVNGDRSNYSMTIIPDEKREYGKCDCEIENKSVEPNEKIRGNIARTYMYMNSVYPGHGIISKKNIKLFQAWDNADPVDSWECIRTRRIQKIQGNFNDVVMRRCNSTGL